MEVNDFTNGRKTFCLFDLKAVAETLDLPLTALARRPSERL
jgi:hypothetical protein